MAGSGPGHFSLQKDPPKYAKYQAVLNSLYSFLRYNESNNYVDGLISFASTVIFLFTLDISG